MSDKDLIERLLDPPKFDYDGGKAWLLMQEAADALEAHQWQPIETAPRGGTEILLFGHGRTTQAGRYEDGWKKWVTWDASEFIHPTHWKSITPPEDEQLTPIKINGIKEKRIFKWQVQ